MSPIPISYFESLRPEMLAQLAAFVSIESPSLDKPALDRMGAALRAALQPLGAQVRIDAQAETGNNIVATWPGADGSTQGGFVIMCHFDTVHPVGMLAENPVRMADGWMYGPGIIDMKGSLTQVLFALRALREQQRWPAWPLTLLLTSDEEVGSNSSRPLITSLGAAAGLVLCMEPALPNGALKTARKGIGGFTVTAHGRAAHAGADHANGVNAIAEMAHQVQALQALTDYPLGTTVSTGIVRGGTRSNVVPDECTVEVDFRVETEAEGARVTAAVNGLQPQLKGAQLEVSGGLERPPMPRSPAIAAAFERASNIAQALQMQLREGSTGGGSDANLVAPYGVAILDGLGPLGSGAHTRTEALRVEQFAPRVALLAAILSEWDRG